MRAILVMTVCFTACAATVQKRSSEAARSEVHQAFNEFSESVKRNDWGRAAAFYSDDPEFSWVEDGHERYTSAAQVAASLKTLAGYGAAVEIAYAPPKIRMLDSRTARIVSDFSMTIGDPNSGGFSTSGAFTGGMVRQDAGWRFVAGHSSTRRPKRE